MAETRRVLLVDDDLANARLFEDHYLLGTGYEVHAVVTLEAAVAAAHANPHLVVILDLALPPYSGLETIRVFVAETERDSPIVVVTGMLQEGMEVEAIGMGADSALAKNGLTPQKLQHAIRCAVRRHEQSASRDRAAELLSAVLSVSTTIMEQVQGLDQRMFDLEETQPRPTPGVVDFFRDLVTPEGKKLAGQLFTSFMRWALLALGAGAAGGGVMSQLGAG
jgi:DNA-binding response OmpR family regulator